MPGAPSENDAFNRLPTVIADAANRDRNEAETRHKIIDFILHELLAWPRNRVAVEENIHPGFADYILKKANGEPLVFVEAKKEGLYFELPLAHNADETSSYIGIKKLLTDSNIKAAANQVRAYCADTRGWIFQLHQVIKPVMIPKRYFYDETLSDIPNIEYGHFNKRHSLKRVEIRLERVERFNSYLRSEESREREMYSLGMP